MKRALFLYFLKVSIDHLFGEVWKKSWILDQKSVRTLNDLHFTLQMNPLIPFS